MNTLHQTDNQAVRTRTCEMPGCKRTHSAHGLCKMHYLRKWRHGTPDAPETPAVQALPGEIWRDGVGEAIEYEVSNLGRIRKKEQPPHFAHLLGVPLEPSLIRGYERVKLFREAVAVGRYVHRIVALVFIPNPEGKPHINHKDGNPLNNRVENLEWVTPLENITHSIEVLGNSVQGEDNPSAVLTERDVLEIREAYDAGGVTQKELRERYGIGHTTVWNIVHRNTWRHI